MYVKDVKLLLLLYIFFLVLNLDLQSLCYLLIVIYFKIYKNKLILFFSFLKEAVHNEIVTWATSFKQFINFNKDQKVKIQNY